ncbi:MAG: hypothetical protein R2799_00750 [Crocinitomicaceae bacterium]
MNWSKKIIFLCISIFLLGCSSEVTSSEPKEQELTLEMLNYGLQIGADYDSTLLELEKRGFIQENDYFKGVFQNLSVQIIVSGPHKISSWKIIWKGENKDILAFSKQLENVLKTNYADLAGSNNYYSARFRSINTEVILECIIWEDKIELVNR